MAPQKPAITISQSDHERLWRLGTQLLPKNQDLAEELLEELDRAAIIEDASVPADVVTMGTRLRFTTDTGEDRSITLVFPDEADISAGCISVLTPIGAALIGLSAGQSIDWQSLDGRQHRLTVQSVERGQK